MTRRHFVLSTCCVALALTLLPTLAAHAQISTSGTTVDDFQLVSGYRTGSHAVAADEQGNVYTAGYGIDATGVERWVVRKSADGGATWDTVMTYRYPNGANYNIPYGIAVDAAGNVYVAGYGGTSSGYRWVVCKSADRGSTWRVVDDFATGPSSLSWDICVSPSGAVYVVGQGHVALSKKTTTIYWFVRRSTDGGATWSTVDKFQLASPNSASASAVGSDAAGNVYVAGRASDGTASHWIVRRSGDGGATWATIDDFMYGSGKEIWPASVVVSELSGSVFVTGRTQDTSGITHAILRGASTTPGGVFQTINDYQRSPGVHTEPGGLAVGPSGELVQGILPTSGSSGMIRVSYDNGASFILLDETRATRRLVFSGTSLFATGAYPDAAGVARLLTRKY